MCAFFHSRLILVSHTGTHTLGTKPWEQNPGIMDKKEGDEHGSTWLMKCRMITFFDKSMMSSQVMLSASRLALDPEASKNIQVPPLTTGANEIMVKFAG